MSAAFILTSALACDNIIYSLHFILHSFCPDGVAVDILEYHLVFVAVTGDMGKLSCLISMNGIFAPFCLFLIERRLHIINVGDDIAFSSDDSISSLSSCGLSFLMGTFLVDHTPCHCPDMCLKYVSSYSGKYLFIFLMQTSCHIR